MKYIIANWKANKTYQSTIEWIDTFLPLLPSSTSDDITIVLCPPYPFIVPLREKIKDYPLIKLGVQDISSYPAGAYNGEVAASLINDLVEYVIIGHSERRKYLHETEDQLREKIAQAQKNNLHSILCVRNTNDVVYSDAPFITYEPYNAISTSPSASRIPLDDILTFKSQLNLSSNQLFVYGGSVDPENCGEYLQSNEISGLLVGHASLDPHQFYSIIEQIK